MVWNIIEQDHQSEVQPIIRAVAFIADRKGVILGLELRQEIH